MSATTTTGHAVAADLPGILPVPRERGRIAGFVYRHPTIVVGGLLVGIAGAFAVKYVAPYPSLAGIPAALPFIILFIVLLAMPRSKLALRRFVVPRPIPLSWQAPIRGRHAIETVDRSRSPTATSFSDEYRSSSSPRCSDRKEMSRLTPPSSSSI